MFAGTEEFYPVLTGMVRAIFGTPDIDDKHREMIILRAASILDVPYEWQANRVMASNAGLTDTEIKATTSEDPSPSSARIRADLYRDGRTAPYRNAHRRHAERHARQFGPY